MSRTGIARLLYSSWEYRSLVQWTLWYAFSEEFESTRIVTAGSAVGRERWYRRGWHLLQPSTGGW